MTDDCIVCSMHRRATLIQTRRHRWRPVTWLHFAGDCRRSWKKPLRWHLNLGGLWRLVEVGAPVWEADLRGDCVWGHGRLTVENEPRKRDKRRKSLRRSFASSPTKDTSSCVSRYVAITILPTPTWQYFYVNSEVDSTAIQF